MCLRQAVSIMGCHLQLYGKRHERVLVEMPAKDPEEKEDDLLDL